MVVLFSFINFSWHQFYHLKPRGHIGSLTEIRENYQNPNPYPPSRPPIYKLADTLEKVHSRKLHGSVLRVNVVFNWSKIFVAFIMILIIAITSWKLRYVGKQNYWVTTMFTKKLPDIVTFYLGYHIQLFSWFLSSYMQPGSRITRRHVRT